MTKIIHQEIVFNDRLKVVKAQLEGPTGAFDRLALHRTDAATVFIWNKDTQKVILIRQYRFPVDLNKESSLLELMAGKVDDGESPESAAVRETLEECGYKINESDLRKMAEYFVSPGYTTERFHLYFAEVNNSMQVNKGGGLEEEHENIEVVEISWNDLLQMANDGLIRDGKTLMGVLLVEKKGWIE